ncbi:MAG: ATP-binding protein, partial [Bacteroidia bacterium]
MKRFVFVLISILWFCSNPELSLANNPPKEDSLDYWNTRLRNLSFRRLDSARIVIEQGQKYVNLPDTKNIERASFFYRKAIYWTIHRDYDRARGLLDSAEDAIRLYNLSELIKKREEVAKNGGKVEGEATEEKVKETQNYFLNLIQNLRAELLKEAWTNVDTLHKAMSFYQVILNSNEAKKEKKMADLSVRLFAMNNMNEVRFRLGEYDEAIQGYHQALKEIGQATQKIRKDLRSKSAKDASKEDSFTLSSIQRSMGYAYFNLGESHYIKGEKDSANKYYQKALFVRRDSLKEEGYDLFLLYVKLAAYYAIEDSAKKADFYTKECTKLVAEIGLSNDVYIKYVNDELVKLQKSHTIYAQSIESSAIKLRIGLGLLLGVVLSLIGYFYVRNNSQRKYNQRLEHLNRINKILTSKISDENIKNLIGSLYQDSHPLLSDADILTIGIYNMHRNRLDFRGTIEDRHTMQDFYYELTPENEARPAIVCFKTGEPMLVNDYDSYIRKHNEISTPIVGENPASFIYVPIKSNEDGQAIGVLSVKSFDRNHYTEEDVQELAHIASILGMYLEAYFKIEDREKELRQASIIKNVMFSIVHHDLKPYLNNYLPIYLRKLEKATLDNPAIQEDIRITKGFVQSIQVIVGKFFDRNNINRHPLLKGMSDYPLEPETIKLREFIEGLVYLIFEIKAQENQFSLQIDKELSVKSDGLLLEIIIRNLVENAIKYTHKGLIQITAEAKGEFVEMAVIDSGEGMSADDLDKLFVTEIENSKIGKQDDRKGTGLGLVFVSQMVTVHNKIKTGCKVWAE